MNTEEQKISSALYDCYESDWVEWDYDSDYDMSHWVKSERIVEKYPFLNIEYIEEVWTYPCFTGHDLVERYLELYRKGISKESIND